MTKILILTLALMGSNAFAAAGWAAKCTRALQAVENAGHTGVRVRIDSVEYEGENFAVVNVYHQEGRHAFSIHNSVLDSDCHQVADALTGGDIE